MQHYKHVPISFLRPSLYTNFRREVVSQLLAQRVFAYEGAFVCQVLQCAYDEITHYPLNNIARRGCCGSTLVKVCGDAGASWISIVMVSGGPLFLVDAGQSICLLTVG